MADDQLTMEQVQHVLADFKDPETGRSVAQMDQVYGLELSGTELSLTLALTTHSAALWDETGQDLQQRLRQSLPQLTSVTVNHAVHERPPQLIGEVDLRAKTVIAVGSGKGGVGKSTVAASLAIGLSRAGSRVGLMDADVFGPSIPHLLGLRERPTPAEGKIAPVFKDGMPVVSMGFLIPADKPVVWRGPMLHSAIVQMLRDFDWGELDYLIVDMPPGTGDVPLSLSQVMPLTGAVVVCTPQDVALLDAVKAIGMFRTVNIPVLGMVENMSGFVCPDCDKRYDIFGSGGARKRAGELGVPVLGEVPINIQIRVHGDQGRTDANFEDPMTSRCWVDIGHNLVKNLALAAAKEPPKPKLPVLG